MRKRVGKLFNSIMATSFVAKQASHTNDVHPLVLTSITMDYSHPYWWPGCSFTKVSNLQWVEPFWLFLSRTGSFASVDSCTLGTNLSMSHHLSTRTVLEFAFSASQAFTLRAARLSLLMTIGCCKDHLTSLAAANFPFPLALISAYAPGTVCGVHLHIVSESYRPHSLSRRHLHSFH